MLPPPILDVADRLITTLVTLVDAISPIALAGSTPTFPTRAAQTLCFRLAHLITTLIRFSTFGIRAPAKPTTPASVPPAPTARPSPTRSPAQTLPRRPGWLLAALPGIAPAIATDLAALLADPALAALLAAAPTLHRTLRPLLRGLGLTRSPPSPDATPPRAPVTRPHHAPEPAPPPRQAASRRSRLPRPKSTLPAPHLRTSILLRNRNEIGRPMPPRPPPRRKD